MVDKTRGTATNREIKGSRVGVAAGFVCLTAGHSKAGTQTPRTTSTHPETRPSQTQTLGYPLPTKYPLPFHPFCVRLRGGQGKRPDSRVEHTQYDCTIRGDPQTLLRLDLNLP